MSQSSTAPSNPSAWRADIDGLRAVSVMAVLIFHLGARWLPGGFVGVDVFFVISGFLITGIIARETDEGRFSFLEFYHRRIRRLYPALTTVLAVTTAVGWLLMMPREFRDYGRTLAWTPLFASNFVFLDDAGYFGSAASTRPLLHTWSLGVEEQFYIVFPWVLLAARRFRFSRPALVAGLTILSLAASIVAGFRDDGSAYYLLPMRFWELGFGALLALRPVSLGTGRLRDGLGVAALAVIVASTVMIDENLPFPGWVALFPVGAAAVLIACDGGPASRLLSTRPFVFLGRISYPLYMWHWPLIVLAHFWFGRALDGVAATGVGVLSIVLAQVTFAAIETPIRKRRFLGSRAGLFAVAGVLTVVFVALGMTIFSGRGLLSRFAPADRAVLEEAAKEATIVTACPWTDGNAIAGEQPLCRIGRADVEPDFVVFGDSHLRSLGGELSAAADAAGRAGLYFGRRGCTPLLGLGSIDARYRCSSHLEAAIAETKRRNIHDVILVGRWGIWMGDKSPVPETFGQAAVFFADGAPVPPERRLARFEQAFGETLAALDGRRIALLMSIPEAGFDVPAALVAAHRIGFRAAPTGRTRAEHDFRNSVVRRSIETMVAGRDVHLLDPADALCAGGTCAVARDGLPVYFDANHLTAIGAAMMRPLFDAALKR